MFNKKVFLYSLLRGTVVSLVLYFVPYGIYQDYINSEGRVDSGLQFFGTVVAATLVVTMNLQVRLLKDKLKKFSYQQNIHKYVGFHYLKR